MADHPTILLVEDNADDVLLIRRAFQKAGSAAPLHVESDGEAAVRYLAGEAPYADRARFPLPALMLLDLKLPLKGGLEVLEWLRAQPGLRRLPVVVLTSSRESVDVQRAYDLGANSYLVKPVAFDDLRAMAATLGLYWLNLNEAPGCSRGRDEPRPVRGRAEVGASVTGEKLRILVIDDNPDDRALAVRALRKDFSPGEAEIIQVNDADSLEAALAGCRRGGAGGGAGGGGCVITITDYALRWTDGITVLRRCLDHDPDMPVIMFTNTGTEEVCAEAMRSGLFDYIIKRPTHYYRLPLAVRAATEATRTRRRLAELLEREKELRAEAERANRRKDEFLATLSHELRTPLTPILGLAAMLEDNPALPAEVRADVATIRRNAELEARLVDDLLDISRISRGKLQLHFEVVDAHALLRSAWETCRTGDDRAARLDVTLAPDAGESRVWADRGRLQQVFWNLLSNAVKFTPAGGRVEVRSANPEAGRLRVEVRDTGQGIERDALDRVFDAFEQGRPAEQRSQAGLGLGLTIARTLAELHGGTLRAESEGPRQGSTFVVTLPTVGADALAHDSTPPGNGDAAVGAAARAAGAAVAATPIAQRPAQQPAPRGHILLVDDHPDTLAALDRIVRRMGYAVTTATSVAEALAVGTSAEFDLLVSDIGLPDGTGHDVLRRLSEVKPVKGIAVSGYGMEYDLQRSREAGFADHLVKPVNLDKLRNVIERVLATSPANPATG